MASHLLELLTSFRFLPPSSRDWWESPGRGWGSKVGRKKPEISRAQKSGWQFQGAPEQESSGRMLSKKAIAYSIKSVPHGARLISLWVLEQEMTTKEPVGCVDRATIALWPPLHFFLKPNNFTEAWGMNNAFIYIRIQFNDWQIYWVVWPSNIIYLGNIFITCKHITYSQWVPISTSNPEQWLIEIHTSLSLGY